MILNGIKLSRIQKDVLLFRTLFGISTINPSNFLFLIFTRFFTPLCPESADTNY